MARFTISNATIPADSTFLVTGVNGLISSHIADQILAAGYKVRGTVRSISKNQWLADLMSARHGPDRIQLVEVPNLADPAIRSDLVRGVAGIASVAGSARPSTIDTVDASVQEEFAAHTNLLEAAMAEPGMKSFVFTSSAWAAWTPQAGTPTTLTKESYNELAEQLLEDDTLPAGVRSFFKYMAVKTKVEQAIWEWVAREKPRFAFNTILPDTVLGPILDAERQGGSTAGMVRWLWNGENLQVLENIPPQWFIDGRDLGRVYLACMVSGSTDRQRIFGFADRYSWPKILEILKRIAPEKKDLVDLPDAGWDQTDVPNESALELLQTTSQEKWTSLEKSVEDGVDSFVGKVFESSGAVI